MCFLFSETFQTKVGLGFDNRAKGWKASKNFTFFYSYKYWKKIERSKFARFLKLKEDA